jgi:hypothetical protein
MGRDAVLEGARLCSREGLLQCAVKGVLDSIRRVQPEREPTPNGPYCGARSRAVAGRAILDGWGSGAVAIRRDKCSINVLFSRLCRKRFKFHRASFRVCPGTRGTEGPALSRLPGGCRPEPVSRSACALRNGCAGAAGWRAADRLTHNAGSQGRFARIVPTRPPKTQDASDPSNATRRDQPLYASAVRWPEPISGDKIIT